jgi:hypothetical protein
MPLSSFRSLESLKPWRFVVIEEEELNAQLWRALLAQAAGQGASCTARSCCSLRWRFLRWPAAQPPREEVARLVLGAAWAKAQAGSEEDLLHFAETLKELWEAKQGREAAESPGAGTPGPAPEARAWQPQAAASAAQPGTVELRAWHSSSSSELLPGTISLPASA